MTVPEQNLGIAALLSLLIPGGGQFYRGKPAAGLALFLLCSIFYFTAIALAQDAGRWISFGIAAMLHLCSIFAASHRSGAVFVD